MHNPTPHNHPRPPRHPTKPLAGCGPTQAQGALRHHRTPPRASVSPAAAWQRPHTPLQRWAGSRRPEERFSPPCQRDGVPPGSTAPAPGQQPEPRGQPRRAQPQPSPGKLRHGTSDSSTTEPWGGLAPLGRGDTAPRRDVGSGGTLPGIPASTRRPRARRVTVTVTRAWRCPGLEQAPHAAPRPHVHPRAASAAGLGILGGGTTTTTMTMAPSHPAQDNTAPRGIWGGPALRRWQWSLGHTAAARPCLLGGLRRQDPPAAAAGVPSCRQRPLAPAERSSSPETMGGPRPGGGDRGHTPPATGTAAGIGVGRGDCPPGDEAAPPAPQPLSG